MGVTEGEIKEYQKSAKALGFRRLKTSTMPKIDEDCKLYTGKIVGGYESTDDKVLYNAGAAKEFMDMKRYTEFNKMSQMHQNYCITKMMEEILDKIKKEGYDIDNKEFTDYLDSNLLKPGFQTAIELVKAEIMNKEHADLDVTHANKCSNAVEYMNKKIMENTLAPKYPDNANPITETDLRRLSEKQAMLATNLMLAHFGELNINEDVDKNEQLKYNGSVSELFAHGSRTMFALPKGEKASEIEDALFDNTAYNKATSKVVHYRFSATHTVDIKNKNGKDYLVEQKSKGSLIHNKGMNMPIGGLDRTFGSDWIIKDKGQDGHVYMKYKAPSKSKIGYYMVGIEGEDALKTGRTGSKHGPDAKKAPISPFGATKHVPGKGYGGRVVDLQSIAPEQLAKFIKEFKFCYAMHTFNAAYNNVPSLAMEAVNKCLCGPVLSREELYAVLGPQGIGMDPKVLSATFGLVDKTVNIDTIVKNQNKKMIDNNKEELADNQKSYKVNPYFNFMVDNFESVKKKVKEDPLAKNVLKCLDKVISNNDYKDASKYSVDLSNLHRATQKYINASVFGTKDEELVVLIKALDKNVADERQLRNELSGEIEKEPEVKEKAYFYENPPMSEKEPDPVLENWQLILMEDEPVQIFNKATADRNRKQVDDILASYNFLRKMDDMLTDAADMTYRDSKEFKKMHNAVSEMLDCSFGIMVAIEKGDEDAIKKGMTAFNKASVELREKTEKYLNTKFDENAKTLRDTSKEKDFSIPTNMKISAAACLRKFTNDHELAYNENFINFAKNDNSRTYIRNEYFAERAAGFDNENLTNKDDKIKYNELHDLYSINLINNRKELENKGIEIPAVREKVSLEEKEVGTTKKVDNSVKKSLDKKL